MSSPDPTSRFGSDDPALVLVSQSPRRRRLLSWLGLPYHSTSVDTPEDLNTPLAADPSALAASLAAEKAQAARDAGLGEAAPVLCFDTIVVLDGEVLGKPADEADAWRMLRALAGRTHQVVTGVAVQLPRREVPDLFSVVTNVKMKALTDDQIAAWMGVGEFMGCAGAYNIEGQVAEVDEDECYQNVAGLPLCHLYAALAGDSDTLAALPCAPAVPVAACDAALGRSCRLGPRVTAAVSE